MPFLQSGVGVVLNPPFALFNESMPITAVLSSGSTQISRVAINQGTSVSVSIPTVQAYFYTLSVEGVAKNGKELFVYQTLSGSEEYIPQVSVLQSLTKTPKITALEAGVSRGMDEPAQPTTVQTSLLQDARVLSASFQSSSVPDTPVNNSQIVQGQYPIMYLVTITVATIGIALGVIWWIISKMKGG